MPLPTSLRCPWIALIVATICAIAGTSSAVPPFQKTLISAKENFNVGDFRIAGNEVTPDCREDWSVTLRTLSGGRQDGVQLIEIDNGRLKATLIPTRGMSIYEVKQDDIRLGWNSPVHEIVHPSFVNLESRNGLGWLEGFNEWMVRCGLEFAGGPGPDEFINNYGEKATMNLTLHGRIGNIPAAEVEVLVDREPPYRIRIRGTVYEHLLHGPKLTLESEVSTVPGSDRLQILDRVTNESGSPQELQLIYHTNYGRPLLEAGARFVVPTRSLAAMNAKAAEAIDQYDVYREPTPGFIEQVYLIEPYANSAGRTQVLLKNAAGDRGSTIRWSVKDLPYFTVWKNTTSESDGYVTGLEPGTCFPNNRSVEREAGRVPKLGPGEKRAFALEFGIHVGRQAVADQEAWIEGVQAGRAIARDE